MATKPPTRNVRIHLRPRCRVVLLATGQNLDGSLELSSTTHERIHLSFLCGLCGSVAKKVEWQTEWHIKLPSSQIPADLHIMFHQFISFHIISSFASFAGSMATSTNSINLISGHPKYSQILHPPHPNSKPSAHTLVRSLPNSSRVTVLPFPPPREVTPTKLRSSFSCSSSRGGEHLECFIGRMLENTPVNNVINKYT